MAQRLIETIGADRAAPIMVAKVYRDPESDGYVVKFFKNGKYRPQADYETSDKADALQTARSSVEMANAARKPKSFGEQLGAKINAYFKP